MRITGTDRSVEDRGGAYHDIIKIIPWTVSTGDQRRGRQRTQHSAYAIEPMQKPQNLIRVGHVANPRIPGRIGQPVAKPGEDERDDQHRIRRMKTVDDIRNQMASWRHQSHSSLAKGIVYAVVQQSSKNIASQGGQKHQRDNGIAESIKRFQLCLSVFEHLPDKTKRNAHMGSKPTEHVC